MIFLYDALRAVKLKIIMSEWFLTVEQVAQCLQLTPLTVRRQLQRGALRGIKRGRVWRVPESALGESSDEPAQDGAAIVVRDKNGVSVVAGTGLKVAHLAALKNTQNLAPEGLQEQFPQLSLAQVYGAPAFYYEHKPEIDADIARREERVADWEAEGRKTQPSRREFEKRAQARRQVAKSA